MTDSDDPFERQLADRLAEFADTPLRNEESVDSVIGRATEKRRGAFALPAALAVIALAVAVGGGLATAARLGFGSSPSPFDASSQIGVIGSASPTMSTEPSATPSPVPSPSPRGDFVGILGHEPGCLLLFTADETYELVLPDGYRWDPQGDGLARIVDRQGVVVASEGDTIGVTGEVTGGGSFCMMGLRHLRTSEIVEVAPANPS